MGLDWISPDENTIFHGPTSGPRMCLPAGQACAVEELHPAVLGEARQVDAFFLLGSQDKLLLMQERPSPGYAQGVAPGLGAHADALFDAVAADEHGVFAVQRDQDVGIFPVERQGGTFVLGFALLVAEVRL